jgi:hypothetical protein
MWGRTCLYGNMTKDNYTGVMLRDGNLVWVRLVRAKDHLDVADTGRLALQTEASEVAPGPGPGAGVTSLGVPAGDMLMRTLRLPAVDEAELAGMVSLQMDKISPFPIKDMVVSSEVLERRGGNVVVFVAAVRKTVLDGMGDACRAAGFVPTRLDAVPLGWWHMLGEGGFLSTEGRQVVLIHEGGGPQLMVLDGGVPIAVRALDVPAEDPLPDQAAQLADEIGYTLAAAEMEHGESALGQTVVWWPGSLPAAVRDAVCEVCGPALAVHDAAGLPSAAEGIARRAAAPAGLLDLTPPAWVDRWEEQRVRSQLVRMAVVLGVLWGLAVAGVYGGVAWEKWRLNRLESVRAAVHEPANRVREMKGRISMIRRYMDRTHSALECLRETTRLMPSGGMELSSFTYRKGESVKVSGQADSSDLVYAYKRALDGSPLFGEGTLSGPIRNRMGKESFDVDLDLPEHDAL